MNPTKIEWTDQTWNPVTGCNNACVYCYARKMANRLKGRFGYPKNEPFTPTFHPDRLSEPLNIKKPSKIFVCSMSDLFGKWVPDTWIQQVLDVVRRAPHHTFQFLTKNPVRYADFDFPDNAWIGYSTEGPLFHRWDPKHKNNIKFVSIEPMSEPLQIKLDGYYQAINFNLLIVGKETGNRRQRITPKNEWIEQIIDFTEKTNIKLFLKNNLNYESTIQEFPI